MSAIAPTHRSWAVPLIEPHQILELLQDPKDMYEYSFPDSGFEFVHDVGLI